MDRGRVFCGNGMLIVGHGLIQTGKIIGGCLWTVEGCSLVTEF
jgi:hypothetical protein